MNAFHDKIRGLGLEFTRQLLVKGERVIATCRQPGRAIELTRLAGEHPGHLTVLPLTLPDARSIADLARSIESLNLVIRMLINNAGLTIAGERFGTIELEGLRSAFAANAAGPLLLTQALAPSLVDGAKVINLSSRLGSIALAEQNGIVVAFSPGWVRTDMGGANAPLAAADSVASMLGVIDGLRAEDRGKFLSHDGVEIPW